jgi:hypothetical protein
LDVAGGNHGGCLVESAAEAPVLSREAREGNGR